MNGRRIFVTGGAGYLGSTLVAALASRLGPGGIEALACSDVREVPAERRLAGVEYLVQDVRRPGLGGVLAARVIDTLVHLAAIVTPGPQSNRALEYEVDVTGTRNVLEACMDAGVVVGRRWSRCTAPRLQQRIPRRRPP